MSSFWLILKQQWTIKISSPLFSIFSLAAILIGSRDHRTQFWKGAIQGPFHQSLVQIGPVASEELIKMWKVNGRTDDGRSVVTIAHMTLWVRWAKKGALDSQVIKVYQLLAHGPWFSPGIPVSSTTKTGRHDIAEILQKVALNTKNSNSLYSSSETFLNGIFLDQPVF